MSDSQNEGCKTAVVTVGFFAAIVFIASMIMGGSGKAASNVSGFLIFCVIAALITLVIYISKK